MRFEDFRQITGTPVSDEALVEILFTCRLQSPMDVMNAIELLHKDRRKAYHILEAACKAAEEKRAFTAMLAELAPELGKDLDASLTSIKDGVSTLLPAMDLAGRFK